MSCESLLVSSEDVLDDRYVLYGVSVKLHVRPDSVTVSRVTEGVLLTMCCRYLVHGSKTDESEKGNLC